MYRFEKSFGLLRINIILDGQMDKDVIFIKCLSAFSVLTNHSVGHTAALMELVLTPKNQKEKKQSMDNLANTYFPNVSNQNNSLIN